MLCLYIHEGYGIWRLVSMTDSARLTLVRSKAYKDCAEEVKLIIW